MVSNNNAAGDDDTDLNWKKSVHSRLKCNLVNFEIPNGFIYKQNGFLLSNTLRTKSTSPPKKIVLMGF